MTGAKLRALIAGNWKMNGLKAQLAEAQAVRDGLAAVSYAAEVMICPPATLLAPMASMLAGAPVLLGGQDCHTDAAGAFTGDIAAEMLKDAGASGVIVGHSERRTDHGETDQMVHAKAEAAWTAGLVAIICIGETREEREAGRALDVLSRQIEGSIPAGATAANTIIAYEPVWAIGTGLTPTREDVAEAHAHIRARLHDRVGPAAARMRILYGGSVKASNAVELLGVANVDGALVGGASLKAGDFLGIAEAYRSI